MRKLGAKIILAVILTGIPFLFANVIANKTKIEMIYDDLKEIKKDVKTILKAQ